jgi:molecular chaperone HscB
VNVETRTRDFFGFLGLARKLKIDAADLEQRYRALSRQFHPDYFYNAPAAERRASLERSSYLNDAYRTLKNPMGRLEYLLKLESAEEQPLPADARSQDGRAKAGPALLVEVFALNEELEEIREAKAGGASPDDVKARLDRAREPIERKRVEHEAALQELSSRWDALVDAAAGDSERRRVLDELQERFLERNYITNLLAGIERELAE